MYQVDRCYSIDVQCTGIGDLMAFEGFLVTFDPDSCLGSCSIPNCPNLFTFTLVSTRPTIHTQHKHDKISSVWHFINLFNYILLYCNFHYIVLYCIYGLIRINGRNKWCGVLWYITVL